MTRDLEDFLTLRQSLESTNPNDMNGAVPLVDLVGGKTETGRSPPPPSSHSPPQTPPSSPPPPVFPPRCITVAIGHVYLYSIATGSVHLDFLFQSVFNGIATGSSGALLWIVVVYGVESRLLLHTCSREDTHTVVVVVKYDTHKH